ncbi:multidrug ABC transporter ATPase [Microbacterium sp. MEC084]|uniref:multidrug ABC transporter ATPase n=1 Tax=Microbacterium sp. MEC084 TaxID=1963027 RepID=UPI00107003CF|nr:multidrug ABC transporter ATPase [Microbacterium sp. MEC084]MCD1268891.1 multidrug ABC transporter ATPase [Microbacterium sp. MEC084]
MSTNRPDDLHVRRIDRVLAFMALGIAVLSVLCFFAIMISTAAGMQHADYATGIWPVVAAIPLFGLPIAFALILVLLIMSFVRRGKANGRA